MRVKCTLCAFWMLFLPAFSAFAPPGSAAPQSRRFEFTYDATVQNIPLSAHVVRIWIPVASSGSHQSITIRRFSAAAPARLTRDRQSGNRMLYAEIRRPRSSAAHFTIVYDVIRDKYSEGSYADLMRHNQDWAPRSPGLERYLMPDRLVPTSGIIREIADAQTRGERGEISEAYSLYNYVFRSMRYDKSGTGWGRGDALWACDAHHGNCTDFHSLFIALARSKNIPARFSIGFPIPADSTRGNIPGYHCWAEFYVHGLGWVPVDISEAWLTPSRHDFFFGSLDANRVRFSRDRDLTLTPRQAGPPVNYFVYPYVEIDGHQFTSIRKKFTFRDLAAEPSLAEHNLLNRNTKVAGAL